MATKSKPAPEKEEAPKRKKLTDKDVQTLFMDPRKFIAFLKILPPNKLIHQKDVDPNGSDGIKNGTGSCWWAALSMFFRDAQGYHRYDDPDFIVGASAYHFLDPNDEKTRQVLRFDKVEWVFPFYYGIRDTDHRAMMAASMALAFEEFLNQSENA